MYSKDMRYLIPGQFGPFEGYIEIPLEEKFGNGFRPSIYLGEVLPKITAVLCALPVKAEVAFMPVEKEGVMKIFIVGDGSLNITKHWENIERAFIDNGFTHIETPFM